MRQLSLIATAILLCCASLSCSAAKNDPCREQIKKAINSKDIVKETYNEVRLPNGPDGEPRILITTGINNKGICMYLVSPKEVKEVILDSDPLYEYLGEPSVVNFGDCTLITLSCSGGGSSAWGYTYILSGNELKNTGIEECVSHRSGRDFDVEAEDYKFGYLAEDDLWSGHCWYRYPYYLNMNMELVEYPARYIEETEAQNLIDLKPVLKEAKENKAEPVNYILRENGDLNVNFVSADKRGKAQFFAVAKLKNDTLQWEINEFDCLLSEGNMMLHHDDHGRDY